MLGTCESFFSFESNLESNRPFTTRAVTQPNGLQAYRTACYRPIICWRLALLALVYFNSVIKRVKQRCCTLILLPKSTLNANLTTTNRFFTNDDRQRGRFENFESDHQYESNHEASQVPNTCMYGRLKTTYLHVHLFFKHLGSCYIWQLTEKHSLPLGHTDRLTQATPSGEFNYIQWAKLNDTTLHVCL